MKPGTKIRVKESYRDKNYAGKVGIVDHEAIVAGRPFCLIDFSGKGIDSERNLMALTMIRRDAVDIME